jgi:ABC-type sugar transport system permease subunit
MIFISAFAPCVAVPSILVQVLLQWLFMTEFKILEKLVAVCFLGCPGVMD